MKKVLLFGGIVMIALSGCVSKKQYAELEAEYERLKAEAPVREAKNSLENDRVMALEMELKEMRNHLEAENKRAMEFERQMKAAQLEPPTPEQLRMYELQNAEAMAKMDPHHIEPGEQGTLRAIFDQENFAVRLVAKPIKDLLKNYKDNQAQVTSSVGRSVLSVNNKELFVEGKSEISEMGKLFLDKIILSFESPQKVDFDLMAVTKDDSDEALTLAQERATNVYKYIMDAKGNPQTPAHFGVVECKNALGPKDMPCGRIEFVFSMNYTTIMTAVEKEIDPSNKMR